MANESRTIVVAGEGTQTGTPDTCEVAFALNVRADRPGEALAQVSELAAQVIAALRELGIEPE